MYLAGAYLGLSSCSTRVTGKEKKKKKGKKTFVRCCDASIQFSEREKKEEKNDFFSVASQ
jgi:hypothetical protein